jgi:hypothetical protein
MPNWAFIASIELKNTFHVLDPSTNGRSEFGQASYLRTHVNGDWNDDLLSLAHVRK